mgnify:FL=1
MTADETIDKLKHNLAVAADRIAELEKDRGSLLATEKGLTPAGERIARLEAALEQANAALRDAQSFVNIEQHRAALRGAAKEADVTDAKVPIQDDTPAPASAAPGAGVSEKSQAGSLTIGIHYGLSTYALRAQEKSEEEKRRNAIALLTGWLAEEPDAAETESLRQLCQSLCAQEGWVSVPKIATQEMRVNTVNAYLPLASEGLMPTTTTERMRQIADDLRAQGAYTSANSVDETTSQRDDLLLLAYPFCQITETANASLGQVTPQQVNALRDAVNRIAFEADRLKCL